MFSNLFPPNTYYHTKIIKWKKLDYFLVFEKFLEEKAFCSELYDQIGTKARTPNHLTNFRSKIFIGCDCKKKDENQKLIFQGKSTSKRKAPFQKFSNFQPDSIHPKPLTKKNFQIPILKVNITSIRTAIKKSLLIQLMTALPIKSTWKYSK